MKKILACLMIACSLLAFGCSGRSSTFGVVDMKKVEAESQYVKDMKADYTKKAEELQASLEKDTKGKSAADAQKIVQDKSAQMQVIQAEAQNKLKASLDTALAEIAKEKNLSAVLIKDVVPQGGVDVTDEVIKKMK
jgi:outer membrane protein